MHYAGLTGPSFVRIRVRRHTSEFTRTEEVQTGVVRVLVPDPEVATLLHFLTEDRPLATRLLHAIPCYGIVHLPGGTHHLTLAHRHAIIDSRLMIHATFGGNI